MKRVAMASMARRGEQASCFIESHPVVHVITHGSFVVEAFQICDHQSLGALPGQFAWKPADRALTLAVLAQSLATLRCCSVARDVMILADIYEEEDFYPSTFGFRLTPPVEDGSLKELLDLAGDALREKVKAEGTCNSCRRNGYIQQ